LLLTKLSICHPAQAHPVKAISAGQVGDQEVCALGFDTDSQLIHNSVSNRGSGEGKYCPSVGVCAKGGTLRTTGEFESGGTALKFKFVCSKLCVSYFNRVSGVVFECTLLYRSDEVWL
jgi:hypothetical protein